MKRLVALGLVVILLLSCSPTGDNTVAVVGGQKISSDELYRYTPKDEFNAMSKEDKERTIEAMCDDYLAYRYLKDAGSYDNNDVMWEVRVWELQEIANGAFQNLIIDKILTEDVLHRLYEKMKVEVNVSHILVSHNAAANKLNERSKEEAEALVTNIMEKVTPDNFSELALEYSDDGSVSENSGDIGWGQSGTWVEPFEDIAFSLKPGEISQPVETAFGYHIIKLNQERSLDVEPYEQMRFELSDILFNRWRDKFAAREDFVYDSLKNVNALVYDDRAVTDFVDRFVRLSQNVFYSDEFSAFDILDVFEDTLVVGHLGTRPIDKEWIYQYLKVVSQQRPYRFLDENTFKGFVERNMVGDWLYHAGLDLGLDESDDYLKTRNVYLAKKSGPLFDKLFVFNAIHPDSQELRDFYDEYKDTLYLIKERVSVREVLLEDSLKANDILKRARQGEDMGELAEKYSIRNYGKKNKGLIPAVKKNQYGDMSLAAFNMFDGEIAGPFKLGKNYSVIQRVGFIPAANRSFEDVSYRLLTDYRREYMPEKKDEQQKMLRDKYSVKVNKSFIK